MNDSQPCQFLEWDTQFFGHRIARVCDERLSPERLEAVLSWCEEHAIECLYFLADSAHNDTVLLAEKHQFHLVDFRIKLERNLRSSSNDQLLQPGSETIRHAAQSDIPGLKSIAHEAHTLSRYYYDPCFSKESCQALYEIWIENSYRGFADATLVIDSGGIPAGYVTCHLADKINPARIGLLGVSPQARGRGFGKVLVQGAIEWFSSQNVDKIHVITQGRNVSAQRLYGRCGFSINSVKIWYHRWFISCHTHNRSAQDQV